MDFFAAMEIGPQPHGVVRSNIYTAMKLGVQHMLDWVRSFNSGAVKHRLPLSTFALLHDSKLSQVLQTLCNFKPFCVLFKAIVHLFCFCFQVLFLKEDVWMCSP